MIWPSYTTSLLKWGQIEVGGSSPPYTPVFPPIATFNWIRLLHLYALRLRVSSGTRIGGARLAAMLIFRFALVCARSFQASSRHVCLILPFLTLRRARTSTLPTTYLQSILPSYPSPIYTAPPHTNKI